MRKLLALATLAGTVAACQPTAPVTQVAAAAPAAPARPPAPAPEAPRPPALPDSLTPAMRTTLRQVNLASLFATPQHAQVAASQAVLDGFFGTDPQRLSLAILTATRDSLRPEVLHVTGKTRFRKQVAAFTGTICLTRLLDFYDQALLLSQGADGFVQDTTQEGAPVTNARAYSATAAFRLTGVAPATQVLTGRALLDFWIMDNGTVGTMHSPAEGIILAEAAAKGSGLLLKGSWQEAPTKPGRPFLVSSDVFMVSPDVISDFAVGDRGAGVNPKYARFGWNTYWENDEWWADSPKPTLNL